MPNSMPIPIGFDAALMKVESLHWFDRPDIVAAGRFIVYRVLTGSKITTIDAYLQTDGRVDMWEDDGPRSVDHADGDYSGRPAEDWRQVVEPLLAAALGKSLEARQGQQP